MTADTFGTQATAPDHSLLDEDCRHLFALDFNWTLVNHGAYGATPRKVLDFQHTLRRQMERLPTQFMRSQPEALRKAAADLAAHLNAQASDLAFVGNATTGINTVLKSLSFSPGDEIVLFSHSYPAVKNTVQTISKTHDVRVVVAPMPFPDPSLPSIRNALCSRLGRKTRLVLLDHITSSSGIKMPLPDLIEICRKASVPVLVDGAHAPGQMDVDLTALNPAWYVGTCHKWLFAPRATAFLWSNPKNTAAIHPLVTSRGYGQGFAAEFDWTGTCDMTAALSVQEAIRFHGQLGGTARQMKNHKLACEASRFLASAWGTRAGAQEAFLANMAAVELPIVSKYSTPDDLEDIRSALIARKCDISLALLEGRIWLRISANVYNDWQDYVRLARQVQEALKKPVQRPRSRPTE